LLNQFCPVSAVRRLKAKTPDRRFCTFLHFHFKRTLGHNFKESDSRLDRSAQ
jgi:hypothetical protein